mmetsp:Transcript_18961/g.44021  ORF Transcript_18961/g.44021 Transcript_18961/m.44021 type:complete len:238 (+) Transcript_18961:554-1267(+)
MVHSTAGFSRLAMDRRFVRDRFVREPFRHPSNRVGSDPGGKRRSLPPERDREEPRAARVRRRDRNLAPNGDRRSTAIDAVGDPEPRFLARSLDPRFRAVHDGAGPRLRVLVDRRFLPVSARAVPQGRVGRPASGVSDRRRGVVLGDPRVDGAARNRHDVRVRFGLGSVDGTEEAAVPAEQNGRSHARELPGLRHQVRLVDRRLRRSESQGRLGLVDRLRLGTLRNRVYSASLFVAQT